MLMKGYLKFKNIKVNDLDCFNLANAGLPTTVHSVSGRNRNHQLACVTPMLTSSTDYHCGSTKNKDTEDKSSGCTHPSAALQLSETTTHYLPQ